MTGTPTLRVPDAALTLSDFGAAFGERVILSRVTLTIPDRGVVVLVGPAGTGKSTLLRTLAGFNSASPTFRTWGEARYAGQALGDSDRPALVAQNARMLLASVLENIVRELPERHTLTLPQQRMLARRLLEQAGLPELVDRLQDSVATLPLATQRHLAILRTAAASPRLLCIDEPTAALPDCESQRLIEYIRQEGRRRAVVVVVHNQQHALALGGRTALLAGGCIQEVRPTEAFFGTPRSSSARDFVRSGSCSVPSPDAQPDELDPECALPVPLPAQVRTYVSDTLGPRGFLWLKNGLLAGTPKPGVFVDAEYDLIALRRVGVTVLVSLTTPLFDPALLQAHGMRGLWFPIEDMKAPELGNARVLCQRIAELMAAGEVVAVHCHAGLGRTGTVLAAQLIWEGHTALDALEAVRRIEPRWVQSDEQVAFLDAFAAALRNDSANTKQLTQSLNTERSSHVITGSVG